MQKKSIYSKFKGCLKGCTITLVLLIFCVILISKLIPISAKSLHESAAINYHAKAYDKALIENTKAIAKDSSNYKYHFLNAKLFLELNDTLASNTALQTALQFIQKDSLRFEFYKNIVNWRISKNDTIQTEQILKHLTTIFPLKRLNSFSETFYYASDKAYSLGNPNLGSIFLQRLLDTIKQYQSTIPLPRYKQKHYRAYKLFFKHKDSIKGLKILKTLIKDCPNSKLAYKKLGDYFLKKQTNKAIHYYKNYLKIDTLDSTVYKNIAFAYLAKKQKKRAIKYFRISTKKGDKEACYKLRELTAKTRYDTRSLCWDNTISYSTGRGTCSHHGGVKRLQYIPYKVYTLTCR